MNTLTSGDDILEQLQQALADEQHALIEYDASALMAATECKLRALQWLEAHPPVEHAHYLCELAQHNYANSLLLARHRREMDWALRYLGRSENTAYDASGQTPCQGITKPLAVV